MTRDKLVSNIRARLKSEYNMDISKEAIKNILAIEEDEVYVAIALEDKVDYYWGTIGGMEKPPKRVSGSFAENAIIRDNGGFSQWKKGVPYCKFSRLAEDCERLPPADFFELSENRYTTLARTFRKMSNRPEIPEYEGLSEEKILQLCKAADKIAFDALPKHKQSRILKDRKSNGMKVAAVREKWKEDGYKPIGVFRDEYDGEVGDIIDSLVMRCVYWPQRKIDEGLIDPLLKNGEIDQYGQHTKYTYQRILDDIRDIIDANDLAVQVGAIGNDHSEELKELEQKYLKILQDNGLEEKVHKRNPFFLLNLGCFANSKPVLAELAEHMRGLPSRTYHSIQEKQRIADERKKDFAELVTQYGRNPDDYLLQRLEEYFVKEDEDRDYVEEYNFRVEMNRIKSETEKAVKAAQEEVVNATKKENEFKNTGDDIEVD